MACSVWVLIRPAEAIEPPDGSSTVVVLLRVRNPGIEIPLISDLGRVVDVRDLGRDPELDAALAKGRPA